MPKILIIRFSSIGDIVLTTPVIRMAKKQIPNAEIHFLTKSNFKSILASNPYIDKLWTIENKSKEVIQDLKTEVFDYIVDLHHNLRTASVKRALGVSSKSFNKLNIEKWVMVNFKRNRLPDVHIVDRYLDTLQDFKIKNDFEGLDYFIPKSDEVGLNELPKSHQNGYLAWVIGGSYFTKMWPPSKVVECLRRVETPIILLGGREDQAKGEEIRLKSGNHVFNACGKFNLNQSASLVKQAQKVLSNDTGLMHVAAAFNKPILSFWGNTIPEFGMTPYIPQHPELSKIMEIKGLDCRPCSKLGYKKNCPKKHFHCMELIDVDEVVGWILK
ncbi:MAG: glycosyltransferase family 9 protein [Flavobacteriales bacterium]|nr:glycosyltransferase family 9 protein [Flavobacteriales bacterium]